VRSVITGASTVLAHVPGMAEHGSKPARTLPGRPDLAAAFTSSLRSFEDAVAYPCHQAWIGQLHPRDLPPRPWVGTHWPGAQRRGPDGEIVSEIELIGLMAAVDDLGLLRLSKQAAASAASALEAHPLAARLALDRLEAATEEPEAVGAEPGAVLLRLRPGSDGEPGTPVGAIRAAHPADDALAAPVLLENLAAKATATLALAHLLASTGVDPDSVDYVLSCGEEAVGDRYQRGGGNLAKAVAVSVGLANASGADVKNFCAGPIVAAVMAAGLVSSGIFRRVAVIAGGSVPKLGMKFEGHLRAGLPILEDVLGGAAFLVEADDGVSPTMRLDCVGRHTVSAGSSSPQIIEALTCEPLARVGLDMTDVDDYATEMHNPEITEPQGSGDVAARNYRTIAALAARQGAIERSDIGDFVARRGMPGFAPTQGHLASAVCYLPHALRRLREAQAHRVLLMAKGSLFLGRMCQESDGISMLIEGRR
jgi:hypothetical protein